jgi:DNA-binding NarL/FixJ family response regulator
VIAASEGFEIDALAQSGEEAVEFAAARRPDLALVDVHMPGIGGREAAVRIAAASPGTAVVLMTATPDAVTQPETMDMRRLTPNTLAEIREELATSRQQRAAQGGGR